MNFYLMNFDFFSNVVEHKNRRCIETNNNILIKLLSNLLDKNLLPLEQIKKISFDERTKPYCSWYELKSLFMYGDVNISIISKKYIGSFSNSDLNDILTSIIKTNNPIDNLLCFTKNHIEKIKNNHINFLNDYFLKNANKTEMSQFLQVLSQNNKEIKSSSLFEEKENQFEYLNLNIDFLMEKYYFSINNTVGTINHYEKIIKDTASFLKTQKKTLWFDNIYVENRLTSHADFLLIINTKDGFK